MNYYNYQRSGMEAMLSSAAPFLSEVLEALMKMKILL